MDRMEQVEWKDRMEQVECEFKYKHSSGDVALRQLELVSVSVVTIQQLGQEQESQAPSGQLQKESLY